MPISNNVIEKEDAELGYPILLVKMIGKANLWYLKLEVYIIQC